jgi:hypothetical protein
MAAEGDVASLTSGLGQSPLLARVMDAVASSGRNDDLLPVIASALGGTPNQQVAAALAPIFTNIRADRRAYQQLHDSVPRAGSEQARHDLSQQMRTLRGRIQNNVAAARALADQVQPASEIQTAADIARAETRPAPPKPSDGSAASRAFFGGVSILTASTGLGAGLSYLLAARSPAEFVQDGSNLSQLERLQARDSEVRQQEELHFREAGPHAAGPPQYIWQTGPDGRPYAIGGHVMMDVSPIAGNPAATVRKMAQVRKAAMAPAAARGQAGDVSADDMAVAHRASQLERQAALQVSSPASTWPTSMTSVRKAATAAAAAGPPSPQAAAAPAGSSLAAPKASASVDWGSMGGKDDKDKGPMKITGTLKVTADGSGELDATPNFMGGPSSAPAL